MSTNNRYALSTDKIVNLITPFFLGGRAFILFVQSLLAPLQDINNVFVGYAKDKGIEAKMSSQAIYLEWYLTYKFKKYFTNPNAQITIEDNDGFGVPLYKEGQTIQEPYIVWTSPVLGEACADNSKKPKGFFLESENSGPNNASFIVSVPSINASSGVTSITIAPMIASVVDTYKLAGKTYLIKITK